MRVLAVLALLAGSLLIKGATTADDPVKATLASMGLERKIGQMLMFGFPSTDGKAAAGLVRQYHLGGVILFKENITGRKQLVDMNRQAQDAARSDSGIGLLISTDEEGGKVERLKSVTGLDFRTNKQWGALYAKDKAAARAGVEGQAAATAKAFRELGLNMNLAPVLDVVTVPGNSIIGAKERAYGTTADVVADLGTKYIARLQSSGVAATAKHFPGHGPTPVDRHVDRPVSPVTRQELDTVHLAPFRAAVKAGVAAIMSAHIVYPAYDAESPATLSPIWLGDVLRGELGFDGVIITDGMLMGAVGKHYSTAEAALAAVDAGADILLYDHGVKQQQEAYQALLGAAKSGRLSTERLDASVGRILKMKLRFGIR